MSSDKVTSLCLVDLDDIELIMAVEDHFDIEIPNEEFAAWLNVGDMYNYLVKCFPSDNAQGKCLTAMAFYRFRRALKQAGVNVPITPKTPMASLSDLTPFEFQERLNKHPKNCALPFTTSKYDRISFNLMVLGIVSFIFMLFINLKLSAIPLLFVLIGYILGRLDKGKYTGVTIGDCVKGISSANFTQFQKEGGHPRKETLWQTLCWVINQQCFIAPEKIGKDTTFYK